ncbi:putative zinc finger protein 840 [Anastrepha ludens]|uniref:putative zinc finger protein 840 n=1 Tax=Anastrepha ludens TaxID=28586 RepID=UPI0023B16563|nr:putative zinc finger protein 840 [Anastrepha ludens]
MLKVVSPTNIYSCNYSKSKCAEIHYQSSTFSILCVFCGMETLTFPDFCDHFHMHYETFINALTDKEELNINSDSEIIEPNFNGKRDPLKFEFGDSTKDTEDVLGILRACKDETATTSINVISKNDGNASDCGLDQYQAEYESDKSGRELIRNKIKLENTDITYKHTTKGCQMNTKDVTTFPNSSESDEKSNEADNDRLHSISIDCQINESIDWSKSYKPNLLRNSDKRPYKARNTPNMCTYCGKTFRRRIQLDTHLHIHTGSKPHQCEICGRLFRAVTTLARHLITHEQREEFSCKFCSKSFSRRAAMLSHELRHTQQRHIPCDECDKLFYTVNQMDTHKRKVHNKTDEASLPFQCSLCTNRYRSASMLSTHKFKKHYKTATIVCEQCGKKFINDQELNTHKAIHICSLRNSQ